jgi:hypothetical protein
MKNSHVYSGVPGRGVKVGSHGRPPVIRMIMVADRVKPETLETSLRNAARKIATRSPSPESNA